MAGVANSQWAEGDWIRMLDDGGYGDGGELGPEAADADAV